MHHKADRNSVNSCQLIPTHYMTNIKLKRVDDSVVSDKRISHPSLQFSIVFYERFTCLTSNGVPLHQFLGTLCHYKLNIQDYYKNP